MDLLNLEEEALLNMKSDLVKESEQNSAAESNPTSPCVTPKVNKRKPSESKTEKPKNSSNSVDTTSTCFTPKTNIHSSIKANSIPDNKKTIKKK